MRTSPETSQILYNWVSLQEAGKRLGVTPDHIVSLGEAGEIEVTDLRLPGAKRGVYRVNPEGVDALRERRRIGKVA